MNFGVYFLVEKLVALDNYPIKAIEILGQKSIKNQMYPFPPRHLSGEFHFVVLIFWCGFFLGGGI